MHDLHKQKSGLGVRSLPRRAQVTTVEPVEWRSRREASLGLSQDAYAAWIGTSQAAVSNQSIGRRPPATPGLCAWGVGTGRHHGGSDSSRSWLT